MLRASAAANNISVNLKSVTDTTLESGVEHGGLLLAFADAVCGSNAAALDIARTALRDTMGPGALVQAAAIAGNFSMNDRAANAMGIPMEGMFLVDSQQYRTELGLNDFPSARNTPER